MSANVSAPRPWLFTTRQMEADSSRLAEERFFNRMLCLERKRSERTDDLFALMILDISGLNGSATTERIHGICRALQAETRDTDLYGWYRHPSVIGAIFTALQSKDRPAIESALARKIGSALGQVLEPGDLNSLALTFHFFPEESGENKPDLRSDETLYPDVKAKSAPLSLNQVLKRVIDVAGSLTGLLLFSPVILLIGLLIKLTSKGPVLFRQKRVGRFGREFSFLKFRTMHVNNSPEIHRAYIQNLIQQHAPGKAVGQIAKPVFKIVNDPRVTPLGRFLRKTSLDELPQFINVLLGDMSLVGPRPPIPYEVAIYKCWHRRRVIEVKPGITGLWQVQGRSSTTFDEMVRLDLRYVREQSVWLDLKILFKTPLAVFSCHGAY